MAAPWMETDQDTGCTAPQLSLTTWRAPDQHPSPAQTQPVHPWRPPSPRLVHLCLATPSHLQTCPGTFFHAAQSPTSCHGQVSPGGCLPEVRSAQQP